MEDIFEKWIGITERVEQVLAPVRAVLERVIAPGSELRRIAEAWPRIQERFASLSSAVRDACERASLPPFRLLDVDAWSEIERVSHAEGVEAAAEVVARLSREALTNAEMRLELLARLAGQSDRGQESRLA